MNRLSKEQYKPRYFLLSAIFLFASTLLFFIQCKPWNEYPTGSSEGERIWNLIERDPSLSEFATLLKQTGLDDTLKQAASVTVWALDNEHVTALPTEIKENNTLLKSLLAHHISTLRYQTAELNATLRIQQLDGKFANVSNVTFEEANIIGADKSARNGVLHIVDRPVFPQDNIWQFLSQYGDASLQKNWIESLDTLLFDERSALQIGVDANTGEAVYDENSEKKVANVYLDSIANLKDESKQFTYFVLQNNVFQSSFNKLSSYYSGISADSLYRLTGYSVLKDFAVEGLISLTELSGVLEATSGAKVKIDPLAVAETYQLSNGRVYVLSAYDILLEQKFPVIKIEGENPTGFSRTDKAATTFYRRKANPDGSTFSDIMVYGHLIPKFHIHYHLKNVPRAKYKVYWRAVAGIDDSQTVSFTQRLGIGNPELEVFPYQSVGLQNYDEVYIGEFTTSGFGDLNFYLIAANTGTTGQNTLSLDYLRLIPVFD
ncbi:fasciclin domain-containing protein [Sphingobacterium sp. LRF_L2]|uniref:fasciclin domain-containing protein n=1 Tax=Sphingobacterium sp. LRF_L2 TaxID=3369421 RepID=UPI003F5E0CF4